MPKKCRGYASRSSSHMNHLLLNAHVHKPIARFRHPLQSHSFQRSSTVLTSKTVREKRSDGCPWRAPDTAGVTEVLEGRRLRHHRTALRTHARRYGSSFQRQRVKIVISTTFPCLYRVGSMKGRRGARWRPLAHLCRVCRGGRGKFHCRIILRD